MCVDRQKIAETLANLTPQERAEVEDLVASKVLREASAREEARDPEGYRQRREHAEAVASAIGPLPPGAEEAVREALAKVVRAILAERRTP